MSVTVDQIKSKLEENLEASDVIVTDISGGCGQSFEITQVISKQFAGKSLLQKHRLVYDALKDFSVHALTVKKCLTPPE
eukprot:CAMPEP_0175063122 /NCGR_PEP_ID=MMETSP0052_2-20121109/14565_1 /TAXON_ID=51329 ORGANISM="Polytomella parva, Strain SAG 63-3" /NCGR_SAMPLE_ID=MMETSP0052_2 /ASSEMBLY_ACC=CAM_ASM_000194 /LENGTH=78 /DNA_ID=CAMNT_0016329253 /DNA_START=28 /DNA_END=264 /DNA_ORIENTATION=-